jgi:hypothetical protein
MEITYLTSWGFAYRELAGEVEVNCRWVDFQKDDAAYKTDNLIVYLEFDFPPVKEGEKVGKPKYSGRYLVRKITQTIRTQKGIEKGYVAILLEEAQPTKEIKKEVNRIIKKYEKEGGLIPLP